jgi:hypothetical protein
MVGFTVESAARLVQCSRVCQAQVKVVGHKTPKNGGVPFHAVDVRKPMGKNLGNFGGLRGDRFKYMADRTNARPSIIWDETPQEG